MHNCLIDLSRLCCGALLITQQLLMRLSSRRAEGHIPSESPSKTSGRDRKWRGGSRQPQAHARYLNLPPSCKGMCCPQGKGAEAAPWWEQASTLGGRSSEACSTHEGAIMDAPSPGSVSNGYTPALRCLSAAL